MPEFRDDLLNPNLTKIFKTFKLDKTYTRGEGCYLWDDKGIKYLDFIAQYGAVPFGYNPEFVWNKLNAVHQAKIPSLVQPSLQPEALKLANRLAEVAPGDLCYCTFCQSGTEAVEAGIKIVRSATGRDIIISTSNSFHGKTLGALSATGKSSYQTPFNAPAPGFLKVPYNDIDALQTVLEQNQGRVAGFIVEPVQGEGGIIVAQPGYLKAAEELCHQYGAALIIDEVQTGLGRSGRLFACDYEQVEPDVLLLAKALGGGLLPMAVCMSSPRVWNKDFAMLHSSTFANNNVTCAVGNAVLDKLLENDRQIVNEVERKGRYLLDKAKQLGATYHEVIKEVRGLGLMVGIEFNPVDDCGSFEMSYLADIGGFTGLLTGFLLNVYHIRLAPFLNNSMTLRLEPSLVVTYEQIDYLMKALDKLCRILTYRDYASLYRYAIGDSQLPEKLTDYRLISRKTVASELKANEQPDHRFAFIVHYPGPDDVVLNNPSFQSYSRDELYQLMQWESRCDDTGILCHLPLIRSRTGATAEGWLIGVPLGGREIMNMPAAEASAMVTQAVDQGRDLGAEIVGLGALTSVVTRGGHSVLNRGVTITSGNSLTTLMAIKALLMGAEKMHIARADARAAVVGANGSIGRACAILLSQQVSDITLFGSPRHVTSSHNRLNTLVGDIMMRARAHLSEGRLEGISGWLQMVLNRLQEQNSPLAREYRKQLLEEPITLSRLEEIAGYLQLECPLKISLDLNGVLPDCNLIVAASNSPEYVIFPEQLQPGAVVCDVARPADVSPQVNLTRDDVLVLEGGLVQYPDQVSFGPNFGYREGVGLGCLSETILLALEGEKDNFSIGTKLSLEEIDHLHLLAEKHGFSLAGLRTQQRELTDDEIEQIYKNSLKLTQAQNG